MDVLWTIITCGLLDFPIIICGAVLLTELSRFVCWNSIIKTMEEWINKQT